MQDMKRLEDEGLSFHPEFMEHFVGEDGKIYGYKGLKIDVWLNALSFHAFVEIQYESKVEASTSVSQLYYAFLGSLGNLYDGKSEKGTTDLAELMKKIFGAGLMEDREAFIQSLSSCGDQIEDLVKKEGEVITTREVPSDKFISGQEISGTFASSEEVIIRLELSNKSIQEWHARLVPLVLLFIEGSQPIEQNDPRWEMYVTIQREALNGCDTVCKLLGFCTVYRFYHYPDNTRLRISQILVLPPYQGKSHGLHLLEAVNKNGVQKDFYDVTVEEPSQNLLELRDCMDTLRLLSFEPVMPAVNSVVGKLKQVKLSDDTMVDRSSERNRKTDGGCAVKKSLKERNWWFPPSGLVEEVRKHLKISKKQFKRCWEVLLFLNLDRSDSKCLDNYQIFLMEQIMLEIFGNSSEKTANGKCVIDIDNEYDNTKTFIMYRSKPRNMDNNEFSLDAMDGNEIASQEDQLKLVFEERQEEIANVAEKVASHCKSLGITIPK
eukprot:Gb_33794 [translate_table: standard]